MIPNQIKVTFPNEFRTYGQHPSFKKYNKIEVIKAIRMLTGWDLKECKDVSESDNVKLSIYTGILQSTYDEALELFRNNGVVIENTFHADLMNTLEKLSIDAIHAKEYSISIRILEIMNTLK